MDSSNQPLPPNDGPSSQDDFELLALRYLEDMHQEDDAKLLDERLKSDAVCRDIFTSLAIQVGVLNDSSLRPGSGSPGIHGARAASLAHLSSLWDAGGLELGSTESWWSGFRFPTLLIALCAFIIGGAITWFAKSAISPQERGIVATGGASPITPVAYLTSTNGCDWGGKSVDVWTVGRAVQTGDEISLSEGIAEFRLGSGVSLSIEGPTLLVMTSSNSLLLQHGKLTAYVPWAASDFKLVTSACRLTASDAEFGVYSAGGEVDIHTFSGEVLAVSEFESSEAGEVLIEREEDLAAGSEFIATTISAGRGLALKNQNDVTKVSRWHEADKRKFATKLTMAGSLPITQSYVSAVMASKPVSYWRFEKCIDGLVLNEVAEATPLKVINGELLLTGNSSNRVAEFGRPGSESYLLSEGNLNLPAGTDYSVELWIKPSHIHDGSCVAMLVDSSIGQKERAAFYLQTCGVKTPSPIDGRSRIRFLHRDPPGSDGRAGTSCFSKSPYLARRWQHVIATKEGPTMRLYIDGVVTSTKQDKGSLAANLRLLVGQLGVWKRAHPFIGQLDELAIYDHALSAEEIAQHIKTIRWKPEHEQTARSDES